MLSIETAGKGIPHIEDLKASDFINALRNFDNYTISEKIDGSNIHFGIDEKGFYTSREHAGGKRIHDVNDYPVNFSTTFQRSAHVALSARLPELISAGLRENHRIEAEVLFGDLPNVVLYANNTNKIVFLRTIKGDMDLDSLQKSLDTVVVELPTPDTLDGKKVHIAPERHVWEFAITPTYPSTGMLSSEVIAKILNLLKDYEYSCAKTQIISNLKADVKEILLESVVRKTSSAFGSSDGWIEGLVFRNIHTGQQFKIVDKDIFISAKNFIWEVRDSLNEKPRSLVKVESFVGKFLTGLASSVGHPTLGTIQAKRYLKKLSSNKEEIITNLASNVDFKQTKEQWIDFVSQQERLLEKELAQYKHCRGTKSMSLVFGNKTQTFEYSGEVDKRTLQVFSSLFLLLQQFRQGAIDATNAEDLIMLLVGDKLKELV
jgi:hypothetical protein